MRFSHTIETSLVLEWKQHYFDYLGIKEKLLKASLLPARIHQLSNPNEPFENCKEEKEFKALILSEMARMDTFYNDKLGESSRKFRDLLSSPSMKADDEHRNTRAVMVDIYSSLMRLENFCNLNTQALRNILKKHDKMLDFDLSTEVLPALSEHRFTSHSELLETMETLRQAWIKFIGIGESEGLRRLLSRSMISTAKEASENAILNKRGFIIDMDGVVYRGGTLLPGVKEFIEWLSAPYSDRRFIFLTNASDKSPVELCHKLARLGVPHISESAFHTAALATARFVSSQRPMGTCYVIGDPGLVNALYAEGYVMNDVNPDFVIVGETRNYSYQQIETAINLVCAGARFVGTNMDPCDKSDTGWYPACGSLAAPIQVATGKNPYFVGKPNSLIIRQALEKLGTSAAETIIIGDRMETDIRAGLESMIDTCLVLSGVQKKDEIKNFAFAPTYVLPGILSLAEHLRSREEGSLAKPVELHEEDEDENDMDAHQLSVSSRSASRMEGADSPSTLLFT
jgi:NagD protein